MASTIIQAGGVSTIMTTPGPAGKGVPAGGTTGQYLRKKSADPYDTEWVTGGSGGGAADASELPFDDSGMEHIEGNSVQDALESIDAQLGESGGGAVSSVNGQTGDVTLDADDIAETSTNKIMTATERTKLGGIAANATANSPDATLLARANHTGTQSADTITDGSTNKAYTATEKTKLAGIASGATANSSDATLLNRANHTGTQTADTITDGVTNKAYTGTEKTKLSGIAVGATANDTDANLKNRANHTGTQTLSTISDAGTMAAEDAEDYYTAAEADTLLDGKSDTGHTHTASEITDFNSAADARITAQKGQNSGLASLDSGGKVPTSQLPSAVLGTMAYQGTWNATSNSPALSSGTGTKGHYYVVATAGSTNLDGETDWKIKDWVVFDGTAWSKVDNTETVTSVNGATGAVVLDADDIDDSATTNKFTTASDISKLAGIAAGATQNSSDATLLARANHTGTQAASTISDFAEAAQDVVGAMLTDSSEVDFSYDDGAGTATAALKTDSVELTKLTPAARAVIDEKVIRRLNPYDVSADLLLWVEPQTDDGDMSGAGYTFDDMYPIMANEVVLIRRIDRRMALNCTADTQYSLPTIEQLLPLTWYIAVNQNGNASGQLTLVDADGSGPVIEIEDGYPQVTWGGTTLTHSVNVASTGWHILTVKLTDSLISIGLDDNTPETTAHSETDLGDWILLGAKSYLGGIGSAILFDDEVTGDDHDGTIARLMEMFGVS